jgi:hydrogenase-4 component F
LATRTNAQRFVETAGVIAPPLLLLGLSLWLGLFAPTILREAWSAAVAQLFPSP